MTLKVKHALVTGSSRGIGRGIALKLAEWGAHITVHHYQNEDAAKNTLAKIRECGSDGFLIQADVCRPEEVSRIFKQVEAEFGKPRSPSPRSILSFMAPATKSAA
jgi:NAD(P)-dependent dehydrogenase (short-subunit alcohol dehydrogenase family)